MTPGSILSQSQAFSTESIQSQSSIHVNIMEVFSGTPCRISVYVSIIFLTSSTSYSLSYLELCYRYRNPTAKNISDQILLQQNDIVGVFSSKLSLHPSSPSPPPHKAYLFATI